MFMHKAAVFGGLVFLVCFGTSEKVNVLDEQGQSLSNFDANLTDTVDTFGALVKQRLEAQRNFTFIHQGHTLIGSETLKQQGVVENSNLLAVSGDVRVEQNPHLDLSPSQDLTYIIETVQAQLPVSATVDGRGMSVTNWGVVVTSNPLISAAVFVYCDTTSEAKIIVNLPLSGANVEITAATSRNTTTLIAPGLFVQVVGGGEIIVSSLAGGGRINVVQSTSPLSFSALPQPTRTRVTAQYGSEPQQKFSNVDVEFTFSSTFAVGVDIHGCVFPESSPGCSMQVSGASVLELSASDPLHVSAMFTDPGVVTTLAVNAPSSLVSFNASTTWTNSVLSSNLTVLPVGSTTPRTVLAMLASGNVSVTDVELAGALSVEPCLSCGVNWTLDSSGTANAQPSPLHAVSIDSSNVHAQFGRNALSGVTSVSVGGEEGAVLPTARMQLGGGENLTVDVGAQGRTLTVSRSLGPILTLEWSNGANAEVQVDLLDGYTELNGAMCDVIPPSTLLFSFQGQALGSWQHSFRTTSVDYNKHSLCNDTRCALKPPEHSNEMTFVNLNHSCSPLWYTVAHACNGHLGTSLENTAPSLTSPCQASHSTIVNFPATSSGLCDSTNIDATLHLRPRSEAPSSTSIDDDNNTSSIMVYVGYGLLVGCMAAAGYYHLFSRADTHAEAQAEAAADRVAPVFFVIRIASFGWTKLVILSAIPILDGGHLSRNVTPATARLVLFGRQFVYLTSDCTSSNAVFVVFILTGLCIITCALVVAGVHLLVAHVNLPRQGAERGPVYDRERRLRFCVALAALVFALVFTNFLPTIFHTRAWYEGLWGAVLLAIVVISCGKFVAQQCVTRLYETTEGLITLQVVLRLLLHLATPLAASFLLVTGRTNELRALVLVACEGVVQIFELSMEARAHHLSHTLAGRFKLRGAGFWGRPVVTFAVLAVVHLAAMSSGFTLVLFSRRDVEFVWLAGFFWVVPAALVDVACVFASLFPAPREDGHLAGGAHTPPAHAAAAAPLLGNAQGL